MTAAGSGNDRSGGARASIASVSVSGGSSSSSSTSNTSGAGTPGLNGEVHGDVTSRGGGCLRLRKMANSDLDQLFSASTQDPIENTFWGLVRDQSRNVPGSKVGEWLMPRERCRIVTFPPPLGKIVAVDGPFCVVDTNAINRSKGNGSTEDRAASGGVASTGGGNGIRVCLAKDLELLPDAGGAEQSAGGGGRGDGHGGFNAFTNIFHFEPCRHKVSMTVMEGPRQESKIIEGPHPYQNNMDTSKRISFPGAQRLLVKFHSQTVTESGCDYIRFAKVGSVDGEATYWGLSRYSGSSGASNWPGVGGSSPLEIKADSFDFKFHSDSSCTYWGWKFTVQAFYPSSNAAVKSLAAGGSLEAKGPLALAAQAVYGDSVQVLWRRQRTFDPICATDTSFALKDPAMVITQSCTKDEAHAAQKKKHGGGGASSGATAGGHAGGVESEHNLDGCTPARVIQKTEDRAWLDEGTRFEGGFLLDAHGSMLKAQEGTPARENFGIYGMDASSKPENIVSESCVLPRQAPVLSASSSKFGFREVNLWCYRRLCFIPLLFKDASNPSKISARNIPMFRPAKEIVTSLRPFKDDPSLYEERSAHGMNILHWLALAPEGPSNNSLSEVLLKIFSLRPNFRNKSGSASSSSSSSSSSPVWNTSQRALKQAWMAKDSCGRTPFMLAVMTKKFKNAEMMFTVCLTSAFDFVIKGTGLAKGVGGFLTPFLLDGYKEILREESACIFENDLQHMGKPERKRPSEKMDPKSKSSGGNQSSKPKKRRRLQGKVAPNSHVKKPAAASSSISLLSTAAHESLLLTAKEGIIAKSAEDNARITHWLSSSALPAYSHFVCEHKKALEHLEQRHQRGVNNGEEDDDMDMEMRSEEELALLEWERDMESLVGSMMERDFLGNSPFYGLLELLSRPIEVHAMILDRCSCDRCYNSITSAQLQKRQRSLRTLFLHLAGNRLMPQYLGKAVLFAIVNHVYQGHRLLAADPRLPGKDGTLGSGGGHGPDGVVGHTSGYQSPRCDQGFSMVLSDTLLGIKADSTEWTCAECLHEADSIENKQFGRWWVCPHCTVCYCFHCQPGPPKPMKETVGILKSLASSPVLIMQAFAAPDKAQVDSFLHHTILTDYLWEGTKSGIDEIMVEYRRHQPEWQGNNIQQPREEERSAFGSLSQLLHSRDFVEKIVSSAARVYCSILCAQHKWPTPLEKSTWTRTEHTNNGGYTGTPGTEPSERPIGAKSGLLGGVAGRISQRCMYIFKLFPIESTACLSKFAKKVVEQLVVPTRGFSSASGDHNNLLNSDALSWHEKTVVTSGSSLNSSSVGSSSNSSNSSNSSRNSRSHRGAAIEEDTPYAWCARTDLAASEDHAKANPPPPTGASFSRILAAISIIVNHSYEELEYGHLSKVGKIRTISGGAGGGEIRSDIAIPSAPGGKVFLRIGLAACSSQEYADEYRGNYGNEKMKSRTYAVREIMLTGLNSELGKVTTWAVAKLGEIDDAYQQGLGIMRDMGVLKKNTGSEAAGFVSLRAREETFSSSRVLLDMFRGEGSSSSSSSSGNRADLQAGPSDTSKTVSMSVITGWASPAPSNGTVQSTRVPAAKSSSTLRHQLPLLELSTKQCESVIFVVGSLLELNIATDGICGLNIGDGSRIASRGTVRALASAHWDTLCSEPGLTRALAVSSLPVDYSTKEVAFKRRIKEARFRMFSGNRAVQELILEIRVLRSQLLATSMGELSKAMMNKPFPELRRPIAIESPRDRNLRVTFSGEQGSGPGVTRGWFSAVTKTIHELINQAANASDAQSSGGSKALKVGYRIGGGSHAPLAPCYFDFQDAPLDAPAFLSLLKGYFTPSLCIDKLMTIVGTHIFDAISKLQMYESQNEAAGNWNSQMSQVSVLLENILKEQPLEGSVAVQTVRSSSGSSSNATSNNSVSSSPSSDSVASNSSSNSASAPTNGHRWRVSDRERKFVLEMYAFFGRFLGLAISCGERLDISFAPHVARYLMGQPANLSDLRYLDPDLYKQLVGLLKLKKECTWHTIPSFSLWLFLVAPFPALYCLPLNHS
jgi:hypothetical protein